MNATEVESDVRVEHLSEDETRALFDRLARRRLAISGAEFKKRLAAGEYDEIADDFAHHPGLMTRTEAQLGLREWWRSGSPAWSRSLAHGVSQL